MIIYVVIATNPEVPGDLPTVEVFDEEQLALEAINKAVANTPIGEKSSGVQFRIQKCDLNNDLDYRSDDWQESSWDD